MYLRTRRLHLIASDLHLATLEARDVASLSCELSCAPPTSWPPPLNDEASQRWFREMLEKQPDAVGWGLWYVVRNEAAERELIGLAGFKGKPVKGCCEMGYSLVPVHQGQGYGSEAARALVRWAFQHEEVNSVSAETLPDLIPSIRVMEKCGMKFVGAGKPEEGHGTVRYSISRAAYAASGRDSS